ncbi:MAG: hypothetical protein PHP20_04780 [Firmicutes bacterium]|jgi:hypothetical protein|nr:hypothetical protein [Bacillota bacterium]MDD4336720.1 hypothetical protein [Bacillota bacterium]MDD4792358.1 hypothetical protein [Bacillota bacterium]
MTTPIILTVAILAITGAASLLFGYLIGRKNRFDLINGYTDEKMLDAAKFAKWMGACYNIMGGVLIGASALLIATKSVLSIVIACTVAVTVVLAVMTIGARRYYRI